MMLQYDGEKSYFLATAHFSDKGLMFLISQKGEYTTSSTYLTPEHASMLRDEIDHWLESLEDTEPQVDLFKGVDQDTTYNDQLNEAIDKAYKEKK